MQPAVYANAGYFELDGELARHFGRDAIDGFRHRAVAAGSHDGP